MTYYPKAIQRPYLSESSMSSKCYPSSTSIIHQRQGTISTKPKRPILPPIQKGTSTMAHPFSEDEYRNGIAALKNNHTEGRDDVLVEQLKHVGPKTNKWSHTMFNVCSTGNKIPKIWRQSKIIAILKPGKDSAIPKNYRPISLLYHTYILYERMILNRIAPVVEQRLIKEKNGFRIGRLCTS